MDIHLLIITASGMALFIFWLAFALEGECFIGMLISLFICVGSLVFYTFGMIKCEDAEWVYDEPYAVESIVALNDNNMTNGKIYLRRGYIEEDLYYQYIVKLRGGGFKANKVKSSNTTLFYDTDNFRVEWYEKTRSWLYFKETQKYHEIYIPEGSLTSDFYIDLS